ncbi:MAG: hypothetical protein IJ831_05950 [Spirochaetales bacterium]|nr:hypothetical protein [Spirochaetales bacterium]
MSSVAKVVIELYESKMIGKEAANRLILACRKGVYWCDGNEDEAMESFEEAGYCGQCFEKTGNLSNVFDNDLGYPDMYNVYDDYDDTAANFCLCPECKQRVIDEYIQKHNPANMK